MQIYLISVSRETKYRCVLMILWFFSTKYLERDVVLHFKFNRAKKLFQVGSLIVSNISSGFSLLTWSKRINFYSIVFCIIHRNIFTIFLGWNIKSQLMEYFQSTISIWAMSFIVDLKYQIWLKTCFVWEDLQHLICLCK